MITPVTADRSAGVLNFGSLNIDHVYHVDHVVRPGETLAGKGYEVFAGGKGANQSAALALAGAHVRHCGRVGEDGVWLRDGLGELGVDVSGIVIDPTCHTGHAVIQVETTGGENAIFLYPGTNQQISDAQIETAFSGNISSRILLLQNEISSSPSIIHQAKSKNLQVCLNPAPFSAEVLQWPLDLVDLLIVNQTEAAGLAVLPATAPPHDLLDTLCRHWPQAEILLTLGEAGALLQGHGGRTQVAAVQPGPVLDTTAAGDTFIGYFLAAFLEGFSPEDCLRRATVAAGICVTRHGARASIPRLEEVLTLL